MNKNEADILLAMDGSTCQNQRQVAEQTGLSLGTVNRGLRSLQEQGLVDDGLQLRPAARELLRENAPKRAILLAAGPGMRMVPIDRQAPKPLLEVYGEGLIERLIRQLREAGVEQICVVIGFMQERLDLREPHALERGDCGIGVASGREPHDELPGLVQLGPSRHFGHFGSRRLECFVRSSCRLGIVRRFIARNCTASCRKYNRNRTYGRSAHG